LVFFLDIVFAVFLFKSFYPPGGIDIFLLAGVERMAHRAYLRVDFFDRTAGLERIPAAAMNHHLIVFWMYPFFHSHSSPKYLRVILTILMGFAIEFFSQLTTFNRFKAEKCPIIFLTNCVEFVKILVVAEAYGVLHAPPIAFISALICY
jgi:hypothetical protein